MSETVPVEIWIGGQLPAAMVPELCTAIREQGVALGWGGGVFEPHSADDLVEAIKPSKSHVRLLRLCDSESQSGWFATLERFLEAHRLTYSRLSAGGVDYDHEKVEFRPHAERVEMVTNSQGEPVVAVSQMKGLESLLAKVLESARCGHVEAAIRSIQAAQRLLRTTLPEEMPPLEPFEIVAELPEAYLAGVSEEAPF